MSESYKLRDGTIVEDSRLARLTNFDIRSRAFSLIEHILHKKKKVTKFWPCQKVLDQGVEGACGGFGTAHSLISAPQENLGIDNTYAREKIYWEAQKIDPFPGGAYPGADQFGEGTDILSCAKVVKKAGFCNSYYWGFSLNDLILGIGYHGPAIVGLPWLLLMQRPDPSGFIHAIGHNMGGHCVCCIGVDVKQKFFLLVNSWGEEWGIQGKAKISFQDVKKLLHYGGEALFLSTEALLLP